jgi:hypothetical protein
MMACKEGTCVIAANILYRIGERRWSEALQATDFEFRGEDSAPSCGYKRRHQHSEGTALSPADPGARKQFLEGSGHTWRRTQQKVDAKGDSFATFMAMEKQTLSYAKSTVGVPSFSGQETFLQFL